VDATEIILLVTAIAAFDALFLLGLRLWASKLFGELARQHPPRTRRGNTPARRYQSIAIGSLNFGGSFAITRDEHHVHFEPMLVARWFGARAFSVPLESLRELRAHHRHGSSVKLGRFTLAAPNWALAPPPDSERG